MKIKIIIVIFLVIIFFPISIAQISISMSGEEFEFDDIESFHSYEGGGYRLAVTGNAIKSGTINLGAGGPVIMSDHWIGGSEKHIVAGQSYTFYVDLEFSEILDANRDFKGTIFADSGGLGTSTRKDITFYLKDDDKESGAVYHKLKIIPVYAGTHDPVEFAEVLVDYGSRQTKGHGEVTITQIEGVHRIYVNNLGEYYSKYTEDNPYVLSLHENKIVEIPITTTPQSEYNAIEKPLKTPIIPGFGAILPFFSIILVIVLRKHNKL